MNANYVKSRLKKIADESNKSFQEELIYYGLERTIYRIAYSKYKRYFTLKGGIFLYATFDKNYARSTSDIDLLANDISNNLEDMSKVFKEIFSINLDDAILFDISSLKLEKINELSKYSGVRVSIIGYLERTKIQTTVDVGFGDSVIPNEIPMVFPSLFDKKEAIINCYSRTSVISEKLEAIMSYGMFNSRYKDFYDIYIFLISFDFNEEDLIDSIKATFSKRSSKLINIMDFSNDFKLSEVHQKGWEAFIKKKKAIIKISLNDVMNEIVNFIYPVIENINNDKFENKKWDHTLKKWI